MVVPARFVCICVTLEGELDNDEGALVSGIRDSVVGLTEDLEVLGNFSSGSPSL